MRLRADPCHRPRFVVIRESAEAREGAGGFGCDPGSGRGGSHATTAVFVTFAGRAGSRAELAPLWGDPFALEQVFLNLALNSRDAMTREPNHGEPNPGVRSVSGLARSPMDPNQMEIVFEDSGPGFPPDCCLGSSSRSSRPERAARGSASACRRRSCAPIAARSARRIAPRGRAIRVDGPHRGRRNGGRREPRRRQSQLSNPMSTNPTPRPRLLLVDDEPYVLESLRRVLESEGFECLTAADAESAMPIFRRSDPQVVVTDLSLSRRGWGSRCCGACAKPIPIVR